MKNVMLILLTVVVGVHFATRIFQKFRVCKAK
jgi:hypothetical protein